MILRRVSKEFKVFALLLFAGFLLGNILMIMLAIVPMVYVCYTFIKREPSKITISRDPGDRSIYVKENIEIHEELNVGEGVGIVTVFDQLPPYFRIVEGSNFRVLWKGNDALTVRLSYTVQCTRRGYYEICQTRFEVMHFAGLKQTLFIEDEGHVDLVVQQRPLDLRRLRDPRLLSRIPMPIGSVSKLGALTTDFKEIRDYRPGDPFRNINWKASVRTGGVERSELMVNDYEREGKKVVWIFLDASAGMSIGSSIENSFEYGVQAAYGLTQFYLARSCRVGIYAYNSGRHVLPDVGRRQKAMISKMLMSIEMTSQRNMLTSSVMDCLGHIKGSSPMFIVVTMIRQENMKELIDGIRQMRVSSGNRGQVIVIHVDANAIAATNKEEETGALAADLMNLGCVREVSGSGALVLPWDPRKRSLNQLMMSSLRRR